jgi:hypothetical protein
MDAQRVIRLLGAAIAAGSVLALAGSASATTKCTSTVNKETAKYVQTYVKKLAKCEEQRVKGKIPGPCPDSETATKINDARAKLSEKIAGECCGKDESCGNSDDAHGAFAYGRCPDGEGPTGAPLDCGDIAIADASDVFQCLDCLVSDHGDEMVDFTVASLAPSTPGDDLNKCQVSLVKEANKFFVARSKAFGKCEANVLKGKISGPCPDAEATEAIDKAEAKKIANICKKCGGEDKLCTGKTCQNAGTGLPSSCTIDSDCKTCVGGANNGVACDSQNDCAPLCNGGVNNGDPCTQAVDCGARVCIGGGNAGAPCTNVSECPGGTCPAPACQTFPCQGGDCRAVAAPADNEFDPTDIGFPAACPAIIAGGPLGADIEDIQDMIECLDDRAADRTDCTDGLGASLVRSLPGKCRIEPTPCSPTAGQVTVQVTYAGGPANLAGLGLGVGYDPSKLNLPGSGDVSLSPNISLQQSNVQSAVNDLNDGLVITIGGPDPLVPNVLYEITFNYCGALPTAADFTCIVRDAADDALEQVEEGVTCAIVVL